MNLLQGKYLVFFFYPLDFTFVCPTEILAFNDRVAEFKALGAEVGGVVEGLGPRALRSSTNFADRRKMV